MGEVQEMGAHQEVISIVAGGWSVNEVELSAIPGYVIAVNDSAIYLPRVDAVVSMDRKWSEGRHDWMMEHRLPTYLRSGTVYSQELCSQPWVTLYTCDYKSWQFGPTRYRMNGTNSAGVALNLAYVMWPRALYLFGFDMCRGPQDQAHWYPDYPWNPRATKQGKLAEWGRQYKSMAEELRRKNIDVINVSSRSLIKNFRQVRPADLAGMERKKAS